MTGNAARSELVPVGDRDLSELDAFFRVPASLRTRFLASAENTPELMLPR